MVKSLSVVIVLWVQAIAAAQYSPYPTPDSDAPLQGPYLFMGCGKGAWWLNAEQGVVLHNRNGHVEHWALVKDGASADWYYYHERSLDGSVDYPHFRWAIYRRYNVCNPQLRVFREYPNENWTFVCCACFTRIPANAATTKESR